MDANSLLVLLLIISALGAAYFLLEGIRAVLRLLWLIFRFLLIALLIGAIVNYYSGLSMDNAAKRSDEAQEEAIEEIVSP